MSDRITGAGKLREIVEYDVRSAWKALPAFPAFAEKVKLGITEAGGNQRRKAVGAGG